MVVGDIHPCAACQWNEQCERKTRREVVSLGARVMLMEQSDDRAFQKKLREKMVQVVSQQLQLSGEGLALSFPPSLMGSGNSLYSSTSVSCEESRRNNARKKSSIILVLQIHK